LENTSYMDRLSNRIQLEDIATLTCMFQEISYEQVQTIVVILLIELIWLRPSFGSPSYTEPVSFVPLRPLLRCIHIYASLLIHNLFHLKYFHLTQRYSFLSCGNLKK